MGDKVRLWHDYAARAKKNRVEIRIKDSNGNLIEDCKIPSAKYPLSGGYEFFSARNCKLVTDPAVLEVFDRQKYCIGHCYSNTKNLVRDLQSIGYKAESYVGWLFLGADQLPIHHSWAVLNGKSVLDLAEDSSVMHHYMRLNQDQITDMDSAREFMAAFVEVTCGWKNSERCAPVGVPWPGAYYVGCKCDPDEGVKIYLRYTQIHPAYEKENGIDEEGRSPFQRMLDERGLLVR